MWRKPIASENPKLKIVKKPADIFSEYFDMEDLTGTDTKSDTNASIGVNNISIDGDAISEFTSNRSSDRNLTQIKNEKYPNRLYIEKALEKINAGLDRRILAQKFGEAFIGNEKKDDRFDDLLVNTIEEDTTPTEYDQLKYYYEKCVYDCIKKKYPNKTFSECIKDLSLSDISKIIKNQQKCLREGQIKHGATNQNTENVENGQNSMEIKFDKDDETVETKSELDESGKQDTLEVESIQKIGIFNDLEEVTMTKHSLKVENAEEDKIKQQLKMLKDLERLKRIGIFSDFEITQDSTEVKSTKEDKVLEQNIETFQNVKSFSYLETTKDSIEIGSMQNAANYDDLKDGKLEQNSKKVEDIDLGQNSTEMEHFNQFGQNHMPIEDHQGNKYVKVAKNYSVENTEIVDNFNYAKNDKIKIDAQYENIQEMENILNWRIEVEKNDSKYANSKYFNKILKTRERNREKFEYIEKWRRESAEYLATYESGHQIENNAEIKGNNCENRQILEIILKRRRIAAEIARKNNENRQRIVSLLKKRREDANKISSNNEQTIHQLEYIAEYVKKLEIYKSLENANDKVIEVLHPNDNEEQYPFDYKNSLSYREVINSAISCFIGKISDHYKIDPLTDQFFVENIPKEIYTPKLIKRLQKLSTLGNLFRQLTKINQNGLKASKGFIWKKLMYEIRDTLYYYEYLILKIHSQQHLYNQSLHKEKQTFSVSELLHLSHVPKTVLERELTLFEICKNNIGDKLLSVLFVNLNHSNDGMDILVKNTLIALCGMFYKFLKQWIIDGIIDDKYNEFFIYEMNLSDCENIWHSIFHINYDKLPKFISTENANRILCLGKIKYILKNYLSYYSNIYSTDKMLNCLNSSYNEIFANEGNTTFYECLTSYAEHSTKVIMNQIFEKSDFIKHLIAMQRFIILEYGQFVLSIIDNLSIDWQIEEPKNISNNAQMCKRCINFCETTLDNEKILKNLKIVLTKIHDKNFKSNLLTLEYELPKSLKIFFDDNMIIYKNIFNLIWRFRQIEYFIFNNIKSNQIYCLRKCRLMTYIWTRYNKIIHQLFIITSAMIYFISDLASYLFSDLVENAWQILVEKLDTVTNVDDLINIHREYLINIAASPLITTTPDDLITKIELIYLHIFELELWQNQFIIECNNELKKYSFHDPTCLEALNKNYQNDAATNGDQTQTSLVQDCENQKHDQVFELMMQRDVKTFDDILETSNIALQKIIFDYNQTLKTFLLAIDKNILLRVDKLGQRFMLNKYNL